MLTKGALGNLVNRYRAVLRKCHLINVFGSLAVASMLVLGGAGVAGAETLYGITDKTIATSKDISEDIAIQISDITKSKVVINHTIEGKLIIDKVTSTTHILENNSRIISEGCVISNNKQGDSANGLIYGVVYNKADGSIDFNNATFENNTTIEGKKKRYGVIYNTGSLKISNSTFKNNHADNFGGAAIYSGGNSTVILDSVTFESNSGSGYGAVYINKAKKAEIKDCTFSNNTSGSKGAALAIEGNVTFYGKNAFSGNSSGENGGAIYGLNGSTVTFDKDSITQFTDNTASGKPNDIYNSTKVTINGTVSFRGGISGNGTIDGSGSLIVDDKDATFSGTADTIKGLKAKGSARLNDQTGGNLARLNAQLEPIGLSASDMDEGLISGRVVNGVKQTSTVLRDMLETANVSNLAVDRIVLNDVRKRMGDLRSSKEESGVWMRWEGGKLKGDSGLTDNFNTIQIGADTMTGIKNVRAGVSAAFTHGDLDHANGSGEMETYSFSAYGTWMADNGMFADVVARVGFTNTELSVKGVRTDFDNEILSLSGEYGWRFDLCKQFFLEPQVELTYTYVTDSECEVDYASYEMDSSDSFIGRAGMVFGWNLPSDMGNVYARASVVHEFLGDSKITGSAFGHTEVHSLDGDDTWFEYGIGANIKLTDKTYIWADVERTEGAEIDEEWRGTVGIRYSF